MSEEEHGWQLFQIVVAIKSLLNGVAVDRGDGRAGVTCLLHATRDT
jgi:hypothetical protein